MSWAFRGRESQSGYLALPSLVAKLRFACFNGSSRRKRDNKKALAMTRQSRRPNLRNQNMKTKDQALKKPRTENPPVQSQTPTLSQLEGIKALGGARWEAAVALE